MFRAVVVPGRTRRLRSGPPEADTGPIETLPLAATGQAGRAVKEHDPLVLCRSRGFASLRPQPHIRVLCSAALQDRDGDMTGQRYAPPTAGWHRSLLGVPTSMASGCGRQSVVLGQWRDRLVRV